MTYLNDYFVESEKHQQFLARHGEPVAIKEGIRVFETGAVIVEEEFTGRLVFSDPSDDRMTRLRIQHDYYSHSLTAMEKRFQNLKGFPPSIPVRDELIRLQNLILTYREKVEEINAELNDTPEKQHEVEQAKRTELIEYEIERERDRLRAEIETITID